MFTLLPFNALAASPIQGPPDRLPQQEIPKDLDITKPQTLKITPIDVPKVDQSSSTLRTMTPSKFEIVGLQVLPSTEMQALLDPMLGKKLTLAQIVEGVTKVTAYLQAKGYVLSYAYLPAQDFKNRIVKVAIVEGYLSEINIQGNAGSAEKMIREIGQKLLNERPLTRGTFEYYSQVFAQLNGIQVAISAQPSPSFEAGTPLNIVVNRKAIDATVGIVPGLSGLDQVLTMTTNSLTSLAEQITLTVIPSSENKYIGLNYVQPVGTEGAKLLMQASYNNNQQNNSLFDQLGLKYEASNQRLGVFYSTPFIFAATKQLTGSIGLYGDDRSDVYSSKLNGQSVNIQTDSRVLATELNGFLGVKDYQMQGSLGVFKGLETLGANQVNGGILDLDFIRFRGQASVSYLQTSGFGWSASTVAQYSNDVLPVSEKIAFGGRFFGQGYPLGEASGDGGYAAMLEANYNFNLNVQYLSYIQPYVFTDTARTYLNNIGSQSRSLASVGVGLRVSNRKNYNLDVNVAKPVGEEPINQNNRLPRINFSYYFAF